MVGKGKPPGGGTPCGKGGAPCAKGEQLASPAEAEAAEASESSAEESDAGSDVDGCDGVFGSEAEGGEGDDVAEEVRSPFGPEVFPSAAACWAHAAAEHGFSLAALRCRFGDAWTDYHRIRLVNYLRSLGPEEARRIAPGLAPETGAAFEAAVWEDDAWLRPVLDDDPLLFEDDDGAAPMPADAGPADAHRLSATAACLPGEEGEVVQGLRAELAAARRLIAEVVVPGETTERPVADTASEPGADIAARELGRRIAAQSGVLSALEAEGLSGRRVLNAGCGAGLLNCLCAQLGAKVIGVDACTEALALAAALATENGLQEEVTLLRGRASTVGAGGGLACDVLLSERLLGNLRYSPALLDLLGARREHLAVAGRVLPARVALRVQAADFSKEADRWHRPWPSLGGLDLSLLATPPPAVEDLPEAAEVLIASTSDAGAELLDLDLGTAAPEEALLAGAGFSLALRPERCMTALLLTLEAELVSGGRAVVGRTALHLPCGNAPGPRPLRLPGADFGAVDGQVSASWAPGGRLRVSVCFAAEPRSGGAPTQISAEFLLEP